MLKLSIAVLLVAFAIFFFTLPGVQEVEGAPTDPTPTSASESPSIIERFVDLVKSLIGIPTGIASIVTRTVASVLVNISDFLGSIGKGGSTAATSAPMSS